jgi:hypothetical protein
MKMFMRAQPTGFMFKAPEEARIELLLLRADGTPWSLTMSAGTEKFIGRYPRLTRLLIDGPLLDYRAAYPGS